MLCSLEHSNGYAYLIFTTAPDMMQFMLDFPSWEERTADHYAIERIRRYKFQEAELDLRVPSELMAQKRLEFPCSFILTPDAEKWEWITPKLMKMYLEGNRITLADKLKDIDRMLEAFGVTSNQSENSP
jgi:hypothetical protein